MGQAPNFSAFPFDRLRKLSRRDAAIESAVARWWHGRGLGPKVAAIAGGSVRARLAGVIASAPDPHAAVAEVRCGGASIAVAASSRIVRALAQRLLGGPPELDAPRPLTVVEQAIWAVAVGAGLADLGIAGEVWPLEAGVAGGSVTVGFTVELPAALGAVATVAARFSPGLLGRRPPPRPLPAWWIDLPIVVARCALPRASLAGLAVRDVITVDRGLDLVIGAGQIGLSALPGAVEARVATEYVARDMALVDDASVEVTVQLGTVRLSLRQLGELAIGEIVALGRPLAGPYEIRAAGRVVGQGELVDIDGELGVRIVSIADQAHQAHQQE